MSTLSITFSGLWSKKFFLTTTTSFEIMNTPKMWKTFCFKWYIFFSIHTPPFSRFSVSDIYKFSIVTLLSTFLALTCSTFVGCFTLTFLLSFSIPHNSGKCANLLSDTWQTIRFYAPMLKSTCTATTFIMSAWRKFFIKTF